MTEDIGKMISSNPSDIYIERLVKNLRQSIGGRADRISRAGRDILVEIEQKDTEEVLSELRENPELSIDVLRNLKIIWDKDKSFLISELRVADYGSSILLKIGYLREKEFQDIIDILRGLNRGATNFYPLKTGDERAYDLELPGMMLYGCEGFNIGLYLEDNSISSAFIDRAQGKVLDREFFRDLDIENLVSYMGRFDYNAGIFGELAFCRAIEELLQLEVPRRAEYLRILISELFRVTNHLDFLSRISEILGNDIAANLIMIEKEDLLGMIESVTGARVIPCFCRIGGVGHRVDSDILKRIKRSLPGYSRNLKKIENLLMRNFALLERLKDLGIINSDLAHRSGISGPNLRASGSRNDLRKELGLSTYRDIHFTVPYARGGSCLDRISVRISEIYQSLRIIRQVIEKIPVGPVVKNINLSRLNFGLIPFTSSVECPHGLFKVFGEVEGNSLRTFTVLGPSEPALSIVCNLLEGNQVDDIEIIMASLDVSGGETIDYI